MKNDKKFISKKRKKDENDNSEENSNNNNNINEDNNFLKLIKENENKNNNTVKNDTTNNNILISKKDTNNYNSPQVFTFNKSFSFMKEPENKEIEGKNKNEILKSNNDTQENIIKTRNILNNNAVISRNQQNNSENSEESESNSPKNSPRSQSKSGNPKFKSHLQNSRNTAFGLKEISKRVMEIIKQSGQTTYKAISDQIVNEINEKSLKDEKNIRRRIYDSLNVMKSMKLFHRDKNSKTIMWNYDQEFDPLNEIDNKNEGDEKNNECKEDSKNIIELKKAIKEKKEKCALLNKELKGLKNVLERNNREDANVPENNKLYFPFIVIEFQNNKEPKINIALNENQTKAHLGFDEADAMYGDLDMVSKIGNHPNFSK